MRIRVAVLPQPDTDAVEIIQVYRCIRGVWPWQLRCGRAASLFHPAKIDLIAFGETIQRAAIDPQELSSELLIAFGLLQDAADVTPNPFSKVRGDLSRVMTSGCCLLELRWEVLGEQNWIGREGDGLLNDML